MSIYETVGDSYAVFGAETFIQRKINNFDFNIPIIIKGINKDNFNSVKAKAIDCFGGSAIVEMGENGQKTLADADFCDTMVIRALPYIQRERFGFGDLVEIIRRLRDPDGCPWDREQTYQSIRSCAIEEAYELVEAVELNDIAKMLEESGDVMLQGLFHAAIAEDKGDFNFNDVVSALSYKLVSRHTHIFGENKADNPEQALDFWNKAKAKEKGQKGIEDKINSVPKTFSALMRALKIQKIIKKTGFEFRAASEALDKVKEETAEFAAAIDRANLEEEAGDLLFSVVNLLRMHSIDPELALNATTDKFVRRFLYIDKMAKQSGLELEACGLEQMEQWYQEYKRLYESNAGR